MREGDLPSSQPLRSAPRAGARDDTADNTERFCKIIPADRGGALRPGGARLDGAVCAAARAHPNPGSLSGGGQRASGAGPANGGAVRPRRCGGGIGGRGFAEPVCANGYAWWYLDALSDDKRCGVTLIAFIGSVFSPYYAAAKRRGAADPREHCAFNLALYGAGGRRWILTERRSASVNQTIDALTIGRSAMSWDGRGLSIEIDETAVPIPRRVRGRVRLYPEAINRYAFELDGAGRHLWQPVAPIARVEVAFEQPSLKWRGAGYLDWNGGRRALEQDFASWQWSRASIAQGGAAVLYDVNRRIGGSFSLALSFSRGGALEHLSPPPRTALPPTRWRLPRDARADRGYAPSVAETLEDTPFYARSVIKTRLFGEPVTAMHESLSLDRFRQGWVQMMLPFRMLRAR